MKRVPDSGSPRRGMVAQRLFGDLRRRFGRFGSRSGQRLKAGQVERNAPAAQDPPPIARSISSTVSPQVEALLPGPVAPGGGAGCRTGPEPPAFPDIERSHGIAAGCVDLDG